MNGAQNFRCIPLSVTLTRASCATVHLKQRKAEEDPCASCNVGKAHAKGEEPMRWAIQAPFVKTEAHVELMAPPRMTTPPPGAPVVKHKTRAPRMRNTKAMSDDEDELADSHMLIGRHGITHGKGRPPGWDAIEAAPKNHVLTPELLTVFGVVERCHNMLWSLSPEDRRKAFVLLDALYDDEKEP